MSADEHFGLRLGHADVERATRRKLLRGHQPKSLLAFQTVCVWVGEVEHRENGNDEACPGRTALAFIQQTQRAWLY
ncbi:hypothetical protein [Bradyrhizobium cenepequi]|uniref:hypothetical protein n=1 Tax=Bradyrhizobium cenepequi TaxID=2821403 RepID=UPI001CE3A1C6|nr:hypothetical protein [Bradyrhizobium cenepequi]